jgi:hypothetical protein
MIIRVCVERGNFVPINVLPNKIFACLGSLCTRTQLPGRRPKSRPIFTRWPSEAPGEPSDNGVYGGTVFRPL